MSLRPIFGLALILVVSGCHSLPPPAEGLQTKYGYSIYGNFTQEQIDSNDTALSHMEPRVIRTVKKVTFCPDICHY